MQRSFTGPASEVLILKSGVAVPQIHAMGTTRGQMCFKQPGFETLSGQTNFNFPAERGSDEHAEFFVGSVN